MQKRTGHAEDRALFQWRASRAVQNACAEGLGLTTLLSYVGDADDRLIRVSDPIENIDMTLWVPTHPDLRNTERILAMMSFLNDALGAKADFWGGRTRETSTWNLIPREGWR